MALKQPLKDKQLILMSDASFTAAGYAIMIEDDPQQKLQLKRKTYAPKTFGSKTFNSTQLKMSIYAKEILTNFLRVLRIWTSSLGKYYSRNCFH